MRLKQTRNEREKDVCKNCGCDSISLHILIEVYVSNGVVCAQFVDVRNMSTQNWPVKTAAHRYRFLAVLCVGSRVCHLRRSRRVVQRVSWLSSNTKVGAWN